MQLMLHIDNVLMYSFLVWSQTNLEHDVYSRLTTLQEGLIPKKRGADDDLHRINELIQVSISTLPTCSGQHNKMETSRNTTKLT